MTKCHCYGCEMTYPENSVFLKETSVLTLSLKEYSAFPMFERMWVGQSLCHCELWLNYKQTLSRRRRMDKMFGGFPCSKCWGHPFWSHILTCAAQQTSQL
ncbi:hypothetical protein GOODEAATRI_031230 [Goodea atripinnis]|uniref:Uncharacterized protein n=1 Tax=Goodea atripinnis TaxID=208336 RepID=A0ABV0Q2L6_9TELE